MVYRQNSTIHLKIYRAATFIRVIESGGSTYPWVVLVADENSRLQKFVVKLFTPRQMADIHPVAKEVFGNLLAREFELPVPDIALVEFSEAFIQSLPVEIKEDFLSKKHQGLKFGCALMEDTQIVDAARLKPHLKSYDLGTVFAFDSFVMNLDRGGFRDKPNLLVDDEGFVLIDHEQIFPFANDNETYNDSVIRNFENGLSLYPFNKHLFFPALKALHNNDKNTTFDTFFEYLNRLNTNALDEPASFLGHKNISVGNYLLLKNYMITVKSKADIFRKTLMGSIS